jgi:hypothetical protein
LQPSDWPPPGPARMTRLSRIQPKLRLTGAPRMIGVRCAHGH